MAASQSRPRIHPRRPRGRPKAEDIKALDTRILLVAYQTFAQHGYGATSINEIARLARISKGTFYARFPSKAALFHAIMEQQVVNFNDSFQTPSIGAHDSLEDTLRRYGNAALAVSLTGEILQTNRLVYSESSRFPDLAKSAGERFRVGKRQVADIIKSFTIRTKMKCRDPEGAAEMFHLLLIGWYVSVMVTNRAVAPTERKRYVDKAVRMFMAALPAL